MRGCFITFEGGEGVGKSTQIERLRRRFDAAGLEIVATREPGGSPRAETIRAAVLEGRAKHLGPFAEAVLFAAARADHLDHLIRPALARGAVVLSDRFADSTRAYQGALGNIDPALIHALERVVVGETRPDLTLILDAPVETSLARAAERRRARGEAADRFEAEDAGFHERLRRAFLDIAANDSGRCALIDASRGPDVTEEAIWHVVESRLGLVLARIPARSAAPPRMAHGG